MKLWLHRRDSHVVDDVLGVNLLLLEDDVDAGLAHLINAAVVEGFTVRLVGGPDVSGAPAGVLPHQHQGHKHGPGGAALHAGVSVRVGGVSGKVAA